MSAKVPERIKELIPITNNLWWTWNPEGRSLFRNLDHFLWQQEKHNATRILEKIDQSKLINAAQDTKFLEEYDNLLSKFHSYLHNENTWYKRQYGENTKRIAYFSAEYGLHQSLPIYSGGLGVLSGDTCKVASDLGIDFTAVGFMYPEGYFTQKISSSGWQEAKYELIDYQRAPISVITNEEGKELKLPLDLGNEVVYIKVWHVKVGRVQLYLMDTNLPENKPWYRNLTARLYGGDYKMRMDQEIVLGMGGYKVIKHFNLEPDVYHLNEGHSSFLSIARIQEHMKIGKTYEEALDYVRKTTVFTTHTPVPAGHDKFDHDLVAERFRALWERFGISQDEFMKLGVSVKPSEPQFNMTILALRTSTKINGVSKLHAEVSTEMLKEDLQSNTHKLDLVSITNGVHIPSWISGPMRRLFSKYIDSDWANKLENKEIWNKIVNIPNQEFWETRLEAKRRLFQFIRETNREMHMEGTKDPDQVISSGIMMDPDAVTIGFARRFATYKRAQLLFRDIRRLRNLLLDPNRPIQIIFTGKAHPQDDPAKHVLKQIYNQALDPKNGCRIAFIENYDMQIAKFLVQGVDIWLNTPLRPNEASGTSGMKAAANGVLNLSILDGWWEEGYNEKNGWAIGEGKLFDNTEDQDNHDSNSLYELLENKIVPIFYDLDENGIPNEWIKMSKESIRSNIALFSARRMMKEYVTKMYY
ncbi:MAG: alpha-glucan family phosphorylase [Candidatus Kariarchaeaceae archaeon]